MADLTALIAIIRDWYSASVQRRQMIENSHIIPSSEFNIFRSARMAGDDVPSTSGAPPGSSSAPTPAGNQVAPMPATRPREAESQNAAQPGLSTQIWRAICPLCGSNRVSNTEENTNVPVTGNVTPRDVQTDQPVADLQSPPLSPSSSVEQSGSLPPLPESPASQANRESTSAQPRLDQIPEDPSEASMANQTPSEQSSRDRDSQCSCPSRAPVEDPVASFELNDKDSISIPSDSGASLRTGSAGSGGEPEVPLAQNNPEARGRREWLQHQNAVGSGDTPSTRPSTAENNSDHGEGPSEPQNRPPSRPEDDDDDSNKPSTSGFIRKGKSLSRQMKVSVAHFWNEYKTVYPSERLPAPTTSPGSPKINDGKECWLDSFKNRTIEQDLFTF